MADEKTPDPAPEKPAAISPPELSGGESGALDPSALDRLNKALQESYSRGFKEGKKHGKAESKTDTVTDTGESRGTPAAGRRRLTIFGRRG